MIIISLFLYGFIFCLIFFILLDSLNVIPINDLLSKNTNPFHYLSEFQAPFGGSINVKFLILTLYDVLKSYDQSLLELFIVFLLMFLALEKVF